MSELAKALSKVQGKLPVIHKGKTAKVRTKGGVEYSYKYADLADITPSVLPLLAEVGLAWVNKPTYDENGNFVLIYKLVHESGEEETGVYPLPDPTQANPQEIGSAMTYARRYALCSVIGVAPDEDEDATIAKEAPAGSSRRSKAKKEAPAESPPAPEVTFTALQLEVKRQLEGLNVEQRRVMRAWWESQEGFPSPSQLSELNEQQANEVLDQVGLIPEAAPADIPPGEDPT